MQELAQDQIEHVAGARRFKCPPVLTTLALGEEGGGPITTMAVGEEGPIVTTLALGEEDGGGGTPITTAGALGSF